MSDESKVFENSLFGYKPSSVVDYIEKLNTKSTEKLDELESKFYALTEENSKLKNELAEVKISSEADNERADSFLEEMQNLQAEISKKDESISVLEAKLTKTAEYIRDLEKNRAEAKVISSNSVSLSEKDAILKKASDEAESIVIAAEEKAFEIIETAKAKAEERAEKIVADAEAVAARNLQKTRYLLKRQERLKDTIFQHKNEIDSFYQGLIKTFNEDIKDS